MACQDWTERLITYLYEEADDAPRSEVEAHLEGCPPCRAELDDLAATRRLLGDARPEVPRGGPRVVVLEPRRSAVRPWMTFAAGFVCAALLLGGGLAAGMTIERQAGSPATAASGTIEGEYASAERMRPVTVSELDDALGRYRERIDRVDADNAQLRTMFDQQQALPVVYRDDLKEELRDVLRAIDVQRASEVDWLLSEIAAAELRANDRIGETAQAVRYVLLSGDPRLSEQ